MKGVKERYISHSVHHGRGRVEHSLLLINGAFRNCAVSVMNRPYQRRCCALFRSCRRKRTNDKHTERKGNLFSGENEGLERKSTTAVIPDEQEDAYTTKQGEK